MITTRSGGPSSVAAPLLGLLASSPASSPALLAAAAAGTTVAAVVLGTLLWQSKADSKKRDGHRSSCGKDPILPEELSSLLLSSNDGSGIQNTNSDCVYLDYNGTTPVHPLVLAAMLPFLTVHFWNPSSGHHYGAAPRQAIQTARRSLLRLLTPVKKNNSSSNDDNKDNPVFEAIGDGSSDLPLDSLWFTGCGTESDNLAILLALEHADTTKTKETTASSPVDPSVSNGTKGSGAKNMKHIVTTNVEHPAIQKCLDHLVSTRSDVEVTYVQVGPDGRVSAKDVEDAMRPNTVLVTVMLANNESGALMPLKEIGRICQNRGVLLHTDAAQACGKVDLRQLLGNDDTDDNDGSGGSRLWPDLITLVGHKMGAPKGIAALFVRPGLHSSKKPLMLFGGGQEFGTRGGTENVPYMVGMGKAAELCLQHMDRTVQHTESLRTRLLETLRTRLDGVTEIRPNGPSDPKHRLPNTLSIGLRHVQSGNLLDALKHKVAASAGAACHSDSAGSVSAVLRAMQVPDDYARGTLRLTVGPSTTHEEVERAACIIADEAKKQLQSRSFSQ